MSEKVFYKGSKADFIVFIDSEDTLQKWKTDSTVPLIDVVSKYQVFSPTTGTGSQGELATPSKQELELEFGDSNMDTIIPLILKNGDILPSKGLNKGKYTSTNDSNGAGSVAH